MKKSSILAHGMRWTAAALVAVGAVACGGTNNNGDAGAGGNGLAQCPGATALQVIFSPMYSAFDGQHTFQVPAIVNGIDPTAVTWSSSNTAVATVATDSTVGGIMITMTGSGSANIVAQAGSLCGQSMLTVDSATPDDWTQGSQRYNNGIVFSRPPRHDAGTPDGFSSTDPACTNCHGPTAMGLFKDVAHTPEQIGGFSDTVLAGIMQTGSVPDGGYFDTSIVSYRQWQSFHHWQMTDQDVKGVVVYLRSLTPMPQQGSANFGGFGPPDGGFHGRPDGGGMHNHGDGGMHGGGMDGGTHGMDH
jgi:hypothetical protein